MPANEDPAVPKFAANLSFIFQEIEFLDRFAAAAECGFRAVEYLLPYEHPPETIAARLNRHDLVQALFNMPPGNWAAGERGVGALAGREQEFRDGVEKALVYAKATNCRLLHAMVGRSAGRKRPFRGRARLCRESAICRRTASPRRDHGHHRADQQPRHPGLFPQHDDPGDVGDRAGRPLQPQAAARPLPCADHGGRFGAPHPRARRPLPACPDRGQPRPARAGCRRDQLPVPVRSVRRDRLFGLDRLRIPAERRNPGWGSAGPKRYGIQS